MEENTGTNILKIDRSSGWSIQQISSISEVDRVWENPSALALTEIDLSRVSLLPLCPRGPLPQGLTEERLNEDIRSQLKNYQSQGYILLDGAVVAGMLNEKEKIPLLWGEMTESEEFSEISATIRFDGSIFRFHDKPDEYVLTPFRSRGFWVFGYGRRFPEFPQHEVRQRRIMNREVTAAIKL